MIDNIFIFCYKIRISLPAEATKMVLRCQRRRKHLRYQILVLFSTGEGLRATSILSISRRGFTGKNVTQLMDVSCTSNEMPSAAAACQKVKCCLALSRSPTGQTVQSDLNTVWISRRRFTKNVVSETVLEVSCIIDRRSSYCFPRVKGHRLPQYYLDGVSGKVL